MRKKLGIILCGLFLIAGSNRVEAAVPKSISAQYKYATMIAGSKIDTKDLLVNVTYEDGSVSELSADAYRLGAYSITKNVTTSIPVTYTEDGKTVTTFFKVIGAGDPNKLTGISATWHGGTGLYVGQKTIYKKDLTVIGYYDDGKSRQITDYTIPSFEIKEGINKIKITSGASSCTVRINGIKDIYAPVINVTNGKAYKKKKITLKFSDGETGLKKVSINGKKLSAKVLKKGKTVLKKQQKYTIKAWDKAGNMTKSVIWIDRKKPGCSIKNNGVTNADASITIKDSVSGIYRIMVDNVVYASSRKIYSVSVSGNKKEEVIVYNYKGEVTDTVKRAKVETSSIIKKHKIKISKSGSHKITIIDRAGNKKIVNVTIK